MIFAIAIITFALSFIALNIYFDCVALRNKYNKWVSSCDKANTSDITTTSND